MPTMNNLMTSHILRFPLLGVSYYVTLRLQQDPSHHSVEIADWLLGDRLSVKVSTASPPFQETVIDSTRSRLPKQVDNISALEMNHQMITDMIRVRLRVIVMAQLLISRLLKPDALPRNPGKKAN